MTDSENGNAHRPQTVRGTIVSAGTAAKNILQTPVSTAITSAAHWIKQQRDARFAPRKELIEDVLSRIGVEGALMKRVLIVVAHPDDEAIGAGSVMRGMPDVVVVHVTDGAPLDPEYALRKGYMTREDYARQRRNEVVAALKVIGIPEERIRGLGFVDGEAAWQLVELCRQMMDLFEELKPDIVLTHPYEGGHSDHDSTAFAVHLAAGLLNREGVTSPTILELTSYHNYQGRRRLFEFLPFQGAAIKTVKLTEEQRATKRQMFDKFTSQSALLQTFPIEVERFRQAPRYLFTVPPHEGELDYERLCKKMTGEQWRAQAERALDVLRSRMQFSGGFSAENPPG